MAYGDVAMLWYTNPGDRPLAPTRGQAADRYAFAVRDLDAWIAKLKRENVTFLREAYAFGDARAVMIGDRVARPSSCWKRSSVV